MDELKKIMLGVVPEPSNDFLLYPQDEILGSQKKLSKSEMIERNRQEAINVIKSLNLPPELSSVMFAAMEYESGGTFDVNIKEIMEPGATRAPGVGGFQKTGSTLESYNNYLLAKNEPNTIRNDITYYTDAFKNPNSVVGKFLGSGYMKDYQNFMEGKPSAFRVHRGSGIKKVYQPTLEGINEHFTNFMMNPREDARKDSLPKRLNLAKKAYKNIFGPKK
jgi:hypothetical protein